MPTDDDARLAKLLNAAEGPVTIPPGEYRLSGENPILLRSGAAVRAHGAHFHLPERMDDGARAVLFTATDLTDFSWSGGHFVGHCFDHRRPDNAWAPNANTRVFAAGTSRGGATARLTFRDITAERVAGAVVHVEGATRPGSERDVDTFAAGVTVEDCAFVDCGKFMWDYGLLWQILVWSEEYAPDDVAMARRYFRNGLIRGVRMADGDDRVFYEGGEERPLPSRPADSPRGTLCFFDDTLPANVVRGKQYFIVGSGPGFVRIAESPGAPPLRFAGASGPEAKLIHDLWAAFYELYAPTGAGPGKGGVDLVGCRDVRVSGCRLSALGDTMHIQRSQGVVFANNHITGSRMGAFFLAEFCKDATVTGNIVEGTNGSRVMSVEKSCEDVTVVGNTFRGGGRGSWINQPRNLVLQGNLFVNNTTKGERDPWRGRRTFTGADAWQRFPELYFTTHEPGATYGPAVMQGNVFETGPEADAALVFQEGARDVLVEGNVFHGATGRIVVPDEEGVTVGHNRGASVDVVPGFRNPA